MEFFTYPQSSLPPLDGYLLLKVDSPILTEQDRHLGLLLLDGSWKHVKTMYSQLKTPHAFVERSLPHSLQTAYPRVQEDCLDPKRGLASIEALFAAYFFLGRSTEGILDSYHWKEAFLTKNRSLFS